MFNANRTEDVIKILLMAHLNRLSPTNYLLTINLYVYEGLFRPYPPGTPSSEGQKGSVKSVKDIAMYPFQLPNGGKIYCPPGWLENFTSFRREKIEETDKLDLPVRERGVICYLSPETEISLTQKILGFQRFY